MKTQSIPTIFPKIFLHMQVGPIREVLARLERLAWNGQEMTTYRDADKEAQNVYKNT